MKKIIIIFGVAIVVFLVVFGVIHTSKNNQLARLLENFSSPVNVTSVAADGYAWTPNITVDKNSGAIYVVYEQTTDNVADLYKTANTVTNLYIKKSDDGGKTFSNPTRVNDKPGGVFLDGRIPPQVNVGPKGEVYVLWVSGVPAPKLFMGVLRSLNVAVSTDGAKTFSPSITVAQNEPPADRSFAALNVSPDGKIYVGWLQSASKILPDGTITSDESGESTTRVARSLDGGRSFEPSVEVGKNQCECCNVFFASDAQNNLYVSWRQKFDVPSGVPVPSRQGSEAHPGHAPKPLSVRDMVVARSSDGGQHFSTPVKIHDDNFQWNTCVHVGAPMALDSKGVLHVAWYSGKEGSAGFYYATSPDQGQTFSTPIPIMTGDWVPPSRIDLAVDDNNNAWITWEDTAGLTADEVHWRYDHTKARIYLAVITPDGRIIKRPDPLNQVDGMSPFIAAVKGNVYVFWGNTNGDIQSTALKINP